MTSAVPNVKLDYINYYLLWNTQDWISLLDHRVNHIVTTAALKGKDGYNLCNFILNSRKLIPYVFLTNSWKPFRYTSCSEWSIRCSPLSFNNKYLQINSLIWLHKNEYLKHLFQREVSVIFIAYFYWYPQIGFTGECVTFMKHVTIIKLKVNFDNIHGDLNLKPCDWIH